MNASPAPAKTPLVTVSDVILALVVGVVGFVMSLVHQETIGVSLLTAGGMFVVMLVLFPLLRHLMNRRSVPRG